MREKNSVTCPCCGFCSLNERGAYDICGLCGWEDDPAQMDAPLMAWGSNHESLLNAQRKALKQYPITETEARVANWLASSSLPQLNKRAHGHWERDPQWGPLMANDLEPSSIQNGLDYFHASCSAAGDEYWLKQEPTEADISTLTNS